jgi:hypothetical protein
MKPLFLFIAVAVMSVAVQASDKLVGAVEANVITAKCVKKKAVGFLNVLGKKEEFDCKLWVESEYGQQHVSILIDHEVKRGDKFLLVQSGDGKPSLM